MKIRKLRLFFAGLITIVIQNVIGNIIWMNPFVANLYKKYSEHPGMKSMDFVGGTLNWVILTLGFGILVMIIWIFLYIFLYKRIPGKGVVKGLVFGFGLFIVRYIPESFNQWMLFNYPESLIFVQLVNTFITSITFAFVLSIFIKIFKVIVNEDKQ